MHETFADALNARAQDVLDRCTGCGRCYEVCPMPGLADITGAPPQNIVQGVLQTIRGQQGAAASERWAQVCSGSGNCIPACPESINPRFMLALARVAMQRRASVEEQHAKGSAAFANMGRGVRVLSRMQLPQEVIRRLRAGPAAAPPEVVFYTGCNVLKTPHIVLLCLDILDALGVSYQVMGGPGDCCGVLQFRTGDLDASGRIAYRTADRFAATGAAKVLAWCPTCTIQIGENVLPGRTEPAARAPYELAPLVVFLAEQLDRLKPLMRFPVNKRVGLHEHPGVAGVSESAVRILRAIPGLDYVELEQPQVGYMCNTLQHVPAFKRDMHRGILEAASRAGVTALAGVYHACHRELCSHEAEWPFEVVNFLELLGESMGFRREDHFKRLKKMQDTDAILADVMDLVEEHGLALDEVRAVVEKDLLGEQPLPLASIGQRRDPQSAPG